MSQEEHLKTILTNAGSPQPPRASRNAFKPLFHHLPEFKTDGKEREVFHKLDIKNILADKDKIPIPEKWKSSVDKPYRTMTKLARIRKEEKYPDPSFDLNGNGTVSAREYAISKMFDFDGDGKLNAEEKAFWLQRLKEGFEDGLYWDADQGDQRIIQIAGKILLPDTQYGVNRIESSELYGKTLALLNQERVEERRKLNNKVFDNFLEMEKEKKQIISKMCEIKPIKASSSKKKTISEVKEARVLQHRKKAGLSPEPFEEKTIRKDPSLDYIKSPKVHTFTELQKKRIEENCLDYVFKFDKGGANDEIWKFDSRYIDRLSNIPEKKQKEISPEPIPKVYVKRKYKRDLANKVSSEIVFPGYKAKDKFFPIQNPANITYKWSTIEDKFRCGLENRIFDEYPTIPAWSTDYIPLYSSFSKDQMLKMPDLPVVKTASPEITHKDSSLMRQSQMYDSLYKKKENMFNRMSPNKTMFKSNSAIDFSKIKDKSMMKTSGAFSTKNMSLLKKCAIEGIRSSSFKKLNQ